MIVFKTNTAEIQILANKLEKQRRSSFPVVVRQTLNSAAFDMKRKTIKQQYEAKGFEQRNKGFLRFATQVTPAQGFKVSKMKSIAGIADRGIKATDSMAKHETGGQVKRSVIPTEKARVSNSWNKRVRTKNRLGQAGAFPTRRIPAGGRDQKRILVKAAAIIAKRGGGYIHYGKFVSMVERFDRGKKNPIKMKVLYIKDPTFKYNAKRRMLIHDAANLSGAKMPRFFVDHARRKLKL